MTDLTLSDICRNKHGGNSYSEAANASVQTKKESFRNRIVALLRQQGPMTREEIEHVLGMRTQTASARCAELKADKTLEVVGERPTVSGHKSAILGLRV